MNVCKPDFVSCKGKCANNGFYCERQNENVTIPWGDHNYSSTTFGAIGQKRVVNLKDLEFHDSSNDNFRLHAFYFNVICTPLYERSSEEKCCLPMNYRCDGTVECWNGGKTVFTRKERKYSPNLKIQSCIFSYRMKMIVKIAELV